MRCYGIGFLLLTLALAACSGDKVDAVVAEPVRAIRYQVVGYDSRSLNRELSGSIRARKSSQLSFQLSGQVLAVLVDVGDVVQIGDVLAELDVRPFELQLATVEAELASAQATLYERRENYLKQQRVFKQEYVSKSELDRARADYQKAESAVQLAQSRLEIVRRDVANTRLLAPFDGVINARGIEPFEDVGAAAPVFDIQGDAGFEVAILLPGRLLPQIQRGSSAVVSIPALGLEDIPGEVAERGLKANSGGAYPLTVNFNQASPKVQAGMSARVRLLLDGGENTLLIPDSAIVVDGSGASFVYRYEAETSAVKRTPVRTRLWDAATLVVEEGLEPGDTICTAGAELLRDGQQVKLYESRR